MSKKQPKKQPKKQWYNVVGVVTGNKYLGRFLAASPEEAVDMALNSDEACVSLCHHCAEQCDDPEVQDAVASLDDNQKGE